MEIDSRTALAAAYIVLSEEGESQSAIFDLTLEDTKRAVKICRRVRSTVDEQYQGWLQRQLFERQWMLRNFKQLAGLTAEQWLETLDQFEQSMASRDPASKGAAVDITLDKLAHFYENQKKYSKDYIKDYAEPEEAL